MGFLFSCKGGVIDGCGMLYGSHANFPRWFSAKKICEGNGLKVVGEENFPAGPDGKADPLKTVPDWKIPPYPKTLEPKHCWA